MLEGLGVSLARVRGFRHDGSPFNIGSTSTTRNRPASANAFSHARPLLGKQPQPGGSGLGCHCHGASRPGPAHPPNQLDCRPFQVGQSDLESGTGQTRVRRRLLFGLMEKRRRVKPEKAFEERLAEEARRFRVAARELPPGTARELLLRRARQAEAASNMSRWLGSSELQPQKAG